MVTHLDGYGASIEFDEETVRLIGGKVQANIWGTDTVCIPVTDIIDLKYTPANMVKNGSLAFKTARPGNDYATPREDGRMTVIPNNSLVIHWRRKDQDAFAGLYNTLQARVPQP